MSNPQVKIHPLGDLLASLLLGIESVPPKEQTKMVRRAVKEAMGWYDERVFELEQLVKLYQSEGVDEIPEEAEWRTLASISDRTSHENERMRKLARFIRDELDLAKIRKERDELKNKVFERGAVKPHYEYKCVVTVDSIPNFIIDSRGVSLQLDLDVFAKKGWEVVSCVPINAEGMDGDQICWHTVMKRRKK